jgi:hypothetical protein
MLLASYLKDRRRRPDGGWMRANQNFSTELGLYPKINPTRPSLLTRSRLYSYKKSIGPRNQVRQPENTVKDNNRCEQRYERDYGDQEWIKRQLKSSQAFHRTHITDVLEEPQCESDKDQDTSGFLIRLPPYNNPQATPAKIATQDHSNSRSRTEVKSRQNDQTKFPALKLETSGRTHDRTAAAADEIRTSWVKSGSLTQQTVGSKIEQEDELSMRPGREKR